MQKKALHITFHNPNSPEKTARFLVRMLAKAAVAGQKQDRKGEAL
nr:hypothetical protein [uncultured Solibaculum sp.]